MVAAVVIVVVVLKKKKVSVQKQCMPTNFISKRVGSKKNLGKKEVRSKKLKLKRI